MSRLVRNAKQLFNLNCGLESDVSVPPFEVSFSLYTLQLLNMRKMAMTCYHGISTLQHMLADQMLSWKQWLGWKIAKLHKMGLRCRTASERY